MSAFAPAPRRKTSSGEPPDRPGVPFRPTPGFRGSPSNEPTPGNIIEHWFDPTNRPWRNPLGPGGPANEPSGQGADVIDPWAGEPPSLSPKFPMGFDPSPGSGKPIEPFDIAGKFGPNDPIIEPLKPKFVPNIPKLPPAASTAVAALPAIIKAVQAGAEWKNPDPPQSWESGVAGAEGSQQWNDPGTQGAETNVVQPVDTAPAFTDWGGYQLGGDTYTPPPVQRDYGSGGAFSGGSGYDPGSSDWYSGDIGGGSGGGNVGEPPTLEF